MGRAGGVEDIGVGGEAEEGRKNGGEFFARQIVDRLD